MGKALKTVGVIIGAAALIATGVGALAMPALAGTTTLFGVSVGTLNTISSGLVAVGGMLDKPKSQGSAAPDEWTSNPDQPIPFLMGRMGVAGKIVQRDEFGPDNMYQGIVGILSGAGPIRAVTSFAGDKQPVSFGANGIAVSSQWQGEMWMVRRSGAQPDTVLTVPAGLKTGGSAFEWSSAAKLSGKACYLQVLGENSKGTAFPAGIPDPVHVAEGIFGYDPRYDDTYPGGAGPCRLGVRSTYRWIEDGGIGGLNWALGLVENGQVVGGIGASIDGIDVPAFVEVANVADANGWKLAAWPDTSEDVSAVLDQLLQAAGAVRARHAGKISCVSRGAPRASVATITARDAAGDIELDTAPSLFNRLNTITPRFMSEAAGWVLTPANPVAFAQYVTDDGGKHGDQIDYRFVPLLKQAAELAAYDILDAREPFSGTIPLKAHMRHLKRGDTFDIDEPGFLMDGVKCIVLSRSYDPKTAQVRIGFRSETDSKHALALGKTTTLPTFPTLTPTDPTLVTPPRIDEWVITPRPPTPGGTLVPGFDLSGVVDNSTATAVEVFWWEVPEDVDPELEPTDEAIWQTAGIWPPTATSVPINIQGGRHYWIGITYIRDQNYSARRIWGPYLSGKLIAGGLSDDALQDLLDEVDKEIDDKVKDATDLLNDLIDPDALFEGMDDLAEAILKLGRGQTELQRIMETHTRDGGKLVKSIVQVMGGELENAQAAIVEEAYLSLERDLAEGGLRQALALQVNDNRVVAETAISGVVTNLSAEITARQQLGARVGTAEGAITNEATVRATADSVFVQNFSLMGARRGDSSGWILNQSTIDLSGEGTLASVLSGLRATDGSNSSAITTLQTASGNQASQLTTLSNTVGGNTSSITSLFSVTEGLGARWSVRLDGNGRIIGLTADAETRTWVFSGANFAIVDDGNGLSYTPATGRLKMVKGAGKTVLGVSNNIVLWSGSTSVADGDEAAGNGILAIGPGVPGGGIFVGETPNGGGGFHAQPSAGVRIRTQSNAGTATTATVEIDISGATGTVTYEWTTAEPDWVATSPSGKITAFRTTLSAPGEEKRASFTCYVRDSGTGRAFTLTVNAAAIYTA